MPDELLEREARLIALAWSGFQSAARMDEAIAGAVARARPERRVVLTALLDLHLSLLSRLPLGLVQNDEVEAEFLAVFGYAPQLFRDPAQAAAQLLELRLHTAATFLLRLTSGDTITAAEVAGQGQADLAAIIEQERQARRAQLA
ncbi:hypothetical protein [Deinococcus multiflagellatus]|uniref:hypothetical protein n=1 Tax=Deinococcus multiflagellatus TaxID=1656887 RepID=UPI001CCC1BCE|nr:hypothetical protein [Deinococcus multiflagellatus]MBZ9715589.1 hypothetical protein [Deinococcus multiflagellatus]